MQKNTPYVKYTLLIFPFRHCQNRQCELVTEKRNDCWIKRTYFVHHVSNLNFLQWANFCAFTGSPYYIQWRIQDFPRGGGRQLPKVLLFFNFLPKTAWKWKNLDPGGGARPWCPPLDPPMIYICCWLVSTYVVCERLSVMQRQAGVVENLVQRSQFTLFWDLVPSLPPLPPSPENESLARSRHFNFSLQENTPPPQKNQI